MLECCPSNYCSSLPVLEVGLQVRLQVQEAHLPERRHGHGRHLLALEVDLDGEPVGGGRGVGQRVQGAPRPRPVQELPLAAVQLRRGGAEEAVQEAGELRAGEEAGAVLQVEHQLPGPGPVQREHQRGRPRHARAARRHRAVGGEGRGGSRGGGGVLAQVRQIVRYGQVGDRID